MSVEKPPINIQIFQVPKNGFTVIVGDKFADCLMIDEALGVVASALFSGRECMYVKTYEQWAAWAQKYGNRWQAPAALLEHRGVS